VRRLRAYFPRFSYLKEYLPAVYQEDHDSATFTERFLANIEGFYTDLEGKMESASQLFDPRAAPAETLDWLGAWMGLVLDPLWSRVGSTDRRRLLIRFTRRLYERRGTLDGLRFSILLLLDPALRRL
jgi:phage tail-like protein